VIIIIFTLKKLETKNFDILLLLSMKIINFFMVFRSFAPSAYWHTHLRIELKCRFDWGRVTGVMSNKLR